MAAPRNSKFCNRLAVQERFRINLESIINKYDKPFEDSPILDLHKMSSVSDSLKDFEVIQPFGCTPLATDLQKGKKRKGGVSADSALGSTLSPSKSYESSDEESSGNIHLQNYDFTHEASDTLGGFIRYKHLSLSKAPDIVGLKRDNGEFAESSDSEGDLGSIRSGPTYPLDKHKERMKDNEVDMIEKAEPRQIDDLPDNDICIDEGSPQDRVRSWLSDDAFMNTSRHSNMDEDYGDVSTTEIESELSSSMSEGGPGDETKSLLEIKERFVRRVKSILVEGNNETEDISSSADETGGFPQRMTDEGMEGNNNISRTVNVRGGEIDRSSYAVYPSKVRSSVFLNGPLSSTVCDEPFARAGISNQNGSRDKPVRLAGDKTTIIAGHFDDEIVSLESQDVGKDITGLSTVQNGFELVHSPCGKMEWGSRCGRGISAKKTTLHNKTSQVKNTVELHDGKQPQTCLTPTKTKLVSGLTEVTFKTPQGKCTLPFKSSVSRNPSDNPEACHGIIGDIMDFFKSPLPELLTSPMPILSPKGRQRTAQGKRVARTAASRLRVDGTGRTGDSSDTVQVRSPSKPKQTPDVSTGSSRCLDQSSSSTIRTSKETVEGNQSSRVSPDETLSAPDGPHYGQERHTEPHYIEQSLSTEEEADVSLLTDDSSEEVTPFQFLSRSGTTRDIPSARPQPRHSNKLVKIPKTPTQSSNPHNTLEIGSKTPNITSPFSRMRVNSAQKDHTKVRRVQDSGVTENFPHSSKSLVYSDSNQRDSQHCAVNKPDMELLVFSSSENDLDFKQKQKTRRYSPEAAKSKGKSDQFNPIKPHQIVKTRAVSQGNAVDEKLVANERQAYKGKEDDVICSIESFSEGRTKEIRSSGQAEIKIAEFDQTYIVSDRDRKTCIPQRMSPSRRKIDKDQKQWKKNTSQFTFAKNYEDEFRSDNSSTSHKIRGDHSSLSERDDSRSFCEGTSSTSPVKANQEHHNVKRLNKEPGVILQTKDCRVNKPEESNEETPNTKYRSSNLYGPQEKHILTDRFSGRADATFTRSPGYKSNVHNMVSSEDEMYVDNEDPSSPRSEVGSKALSKELKFSTTPTSKYGCHSAMRTNFTTSDSTSYEHSSEGTTKDKQRPFQQPAKFNNIPSDSNVRLQSPRRQKVLIQQEKLSRYSKAARDVSFLSSTRIDEDTSEDFESKDLNGAMSSPSSRLMAKKKPVNGKQMKTTSGTHQRAKQENLSKDQSTWKRRRQGSDRANSLESPAKRRSKLNARSLESPVKRHTQLNGSSIESPAKRRSQLNTNSLESPVKRSTQPNIGSKESPVRRRTQPNNGRMESPSNRRTHPNVSSVESPSSRHTYRNARRSSQRGIQISNRALDSSGDSDTAVKEWSTESSSSLSISSMCEGPGRCTKKICFKCAMVD